MVCFPGSSRGGTKKAESTLLLSLAFAGQVSKGMAKYLTGLTKKHMAADAKLIVAGAWFKNQVAAMGSKIKRCRADTVMVGKATTFTLTVGQKDPCIIQALGFGQPPPRGFNILWGEVECSSSEFCFFEVGFDETLQKVNRMFTLEELLDEDCGPDGAAFVLRLQTRDDDDDDDDDDDRRR